MSCDPIVNDEEVLVRLVFSNTQVNKRHLSKSIISKEQIRDQRLYRPMTGGSCFSCYRLSCCSIDEIKACVKDNGFESEEYNRIFMGVTTLKAIYFTQFGLSIIPKSEHGLDCHVDVCFNNYVFAKGVAPSSEIIETLQFLQDESDFHFDPNRYIREWEGDSI